MRQRRPGPCPCARRLPAVRNAARARRRSGVLAGLLAAAVMAVPACGGSSAGGGATPHPTATRTGPGSPAASSAAAAGSCADRVLARMSLAQRVGQLFVVGLAGSVLD